MAGGHDPYAALRVPGFVIYMAGWVVAVIGQQVQSVAVQWQIYQRIGTPSKGSLALGIVGGVQALPVILLALPAGHLADKADRRRIIAISQLLAAVCSILLALVSYSNGSIYLLYVLLFLSATTQAMGNGRLDRRCCRNSCPKGCSPTPQRGTASCLRGKSAAVLGFAWAVWWWACRSWGQPGRTFWMPRAL